MTDLEAWIIAVIRAAGSSRLHQALTAAETLAGQRFAEADVVTAMRRVLTVESPVSGDVGQTASASPGL